MEYLIGITLALALIAFAGITGLADERAFYPTVAIVVASYYVLFAAMGSDYHALLPESVAGFAFLLLAVLGFKTRLEYVVVALVGHGIFDLLHPHIIANAGVPRWWPGFCMAFDVVLGGLVLLRLRRLLPHTHH
ncbi:MAG: hypothetical protein ABJA49_07430 [Betaproteobacteria bacterium]